MKKIFVLFFILLFLSACANNNAHSNDKNFMDKPAQDGQYHYLNKDLGFNLTLSEEFIYYQTQRKKINQATLVEFFVPTSDRDYPQEIQSYAKPVTIAIFDNKYWDSLGENQDEKIFYKEIKRNKHKVYTIKFWDSVPEDWKEKWDKDLEEEIKNNFSLY